MIVIPEGDKRAFEARLSMARESPSGCLLMAPNFHGTRTYRAYKFYWYVMHGVWPGSLKKTCDVDNCVKHYKEQGFVLTPADVEAIKEAPAYHGVVTALAEKYGVSKARISKIRKTP